MASLTISEIPTVSLLYKLKHLSPISNPAVKPSRSFNNVISLIRHDITKLEVGCIVNAANESLLGGGGVDGAIHRAAGPSLVTECCTLNGCDTGDAKITLAHDLPCERVIHAVGPQYHYERSRGEDRPAALLRGCYRRSLELAVEHNLKSIAFSAISTGVYGYPSSQAARTVLDEVRKFLENQSNTGKLERIIFCNFEQKDELAYERWIPNFFPPAEKDLSHPSTGQSDAKSDSESSSSPQVLATKLPNPPTKDPALDDQQEDKSDGETSTPSSPEVIAARLPEAPPKESDLGSQPEMKKQKLNADDLGHDLPTKADEKSEDDWEEVDKPEGGPVEKLDDEPVEVPKVPSAAGPAGISSTTERLDDEPVEVPKAPSAADVQSVQSSGIIDPDESQSKESELEKDW